MNYLIRFRRKAVLWNNAPHSSRLLLSVHHPPRLYVYDRILSVATSPAGVLLNGRITS